MYGPLSTAPPTITAHRPLEGLGVAIAAGDEPTATGEGPEQPAMANTANPNRHAIRITSITPPIPGVLQRGPLSLGLCVA
jgi:hypothetical protein